MDFLVIPVFDKKFGVLVKSPLFLFNSVKLFNYCYCLQWPAKKEYKD